MSRKRKQVKKQAFVPPNSKYSILADEYLVNSISQYMDYSELIEFGKISDFYKQIIYFKHPGSRTFPITDISEYLKIFKVPKNMRIGNSVNIRTLKLFLLGSNNLKFLDLTDKEISVNIFTDLNLDKIEELVIGKFPKDDNIQLLSYFKKLKKFTYKENTYICPRESKLREKFFPSFIINDQKNYFKDCRNNNITGLFEVVNTGNLPFKYIGHIRNGNPTISGVFYHANGYLFQIQFRLQPNNTIYDIEGKYINSSNQLQYKCTATMIKSNHFPCLNSLNWNVVYSDGVTYKGRLFYGIQHDLTYESTNLIFEISESAKLFYPDNNILFEGSFAYGLKKTGKYYNKDGTLLYDGTFVDNCKEGTGTLYYSNGLVYKGELKNNKLSGFGEIRNKDNNLILKGLFSDDFIVQGDKYFSNNYKVFGRFENGNIVFGTMFKDGIRAFEGFFDKLEQIENGTLYYQNGNKKYIGAISNNKPNGYGKAYNLDGLLIYDGEFLNNEYHGNGKLWQYCTGQEKLRHSAKQAGRLACNGHSWR